MPGGFGEFRKHLMTRYLAADNPTIKAVFVNSAQNPNLTTTAKFFSDLVSPSAASDVMTRSAGADGAFVTPEANWPALSGSGTFDRIVVYVDTGTPATSHLAYWDETKKDGQPYTVQACGHPYKYTWPNNTPFQI